MSSGFSALFDSPSTSSLLKIGTDIVEVERIEAAVSRHGDRFLRRVFTEAELSYCMALSRPGPSLAARFAAKEAVSKCFGTGIGSRFAWTSASVARAETGEPSIVLDSVGQALLAALHGTRVLISLSHTRSLAVAFAAVVR